MCGRYTLFKLEQILKQFPWLQLPPDLRPRYNIAPTQPILACSNESPNRLDYFHWGLIPSWARDSAVGSRMINARAETLHERPAFRVAVQRRRCLIPADGFYEWRREAKGGKTPMYMRMKSGALFMFAGLWDTWRRPDGQTIPSCTIITTSPNNLLEGIHDRMPAIIPPESYQRWLQGPEPVELLAPYVPEAMEAQPVSRRVNSVANEDSNCIEALSDPPSDAPSDPTESPGLFG